MKKAVVLGMILLALGCMAYADGVTVGLDFGRTQFNLASNTGVANASTYQGWVGPTLQFPTGQRIDFQFAWSNDHTGFNITYYMMNSNLTPTAKDAFGNLYGIVNAYGTLKFIPDMFTAYIGEFNGDGWDHFRWDSAHPIHDTDNSSIGRFSGWGAILDLMPKDTGFEAALFMKTADPTIAFQAADTIMSVVNQYGFAASYTIPNLVKVQAGSTIFGTPPTPVDNRNIFAGVQLLMIPNLTAFDSFWYAGFDKATAQTIYSDELAFSYDMKPLTIIFAGYFGGSNATGTSINTWSLAPEVIYNLGAFSLGLYANIASSTAASAPITYQVEPYVKLNDFGVRISVMYAGSTLSGAVSSWEIPVLIDWGF
jgi:hypothetical protein